VNAPRRPSAQRATPPVALRFDIRQLNLRGYTPAQQQRFVTALHAALDRLARERGAEVSKGSTRLDLLKLEVRHAAADPADAAQQLARRLFDRATASGNGHG